MSDSDGTLMVRGQEYTFDDLRRFTFDSICDGVCTECDNVTSVEPDAAGYSCHDPDCDGRVNSVLVVLGFV